MVIATRESSRSRQPLLFLYPMYLNAAEENVVLTDMDDECKDEIELTYSASGESVPGQACFRQLL